MAGSTKSAIKVLVEGAPIHGSNGLMFGADGYLYIASCLGREIVVMDTDSGEIIERRGPDKGVEGPDDLTFGPDGSIYWTEIIQGNVGRMAPDGSVTKQFVAPGVNPITFSDDGRLFVALDFLGDALYELDPDLVDPPRLIASNLGMMNGMDWGPDGRLYGPIWTQGKIVSVNVDGPLDMVTVADGFDLVAAVKFDSQGRLHTVAREFAPEFEGQIIRVDVDTGGKEVLAHSGFGLDNLAFDSQDRLFVSSANDGSIIEVLPGGEVRVVSQGGIISPMGVAVLPREDGGESVYLADMWTIREFDGFTGSPISVQHNSIGATSVTNPMYIAPDGENLILASWFGGVVQVWNHEGAELVEEYHSPWAPTPWVPLAAIRFQGEVVVSEVGSGSVIPAAGGEPLASGLFVPMGLAATEDDLFVSDWASGMVWQIVTDGEPSMSAVASGLASPEGLAWDIDGSLLVVESGAGRVSSIDPGTGEVSTVVEGLALGLLGMPGTPPASNFNGLNVGKLGHIYVAGDVTNVIYRIGATERISRTIEELPDEAFDPPKRAAKFKRRCRRRLDQAQHMIDRGRYYAARAILRVFRRRMDGTLTDDPSDDRNDFITDAEAQQSITSLIDALLSSLDQEINR